MKKFNKWGANHKNIVPFDIKLVTHPDPNAAAFRIYSDKEDFYLFVIPNYENKTVEVSTDINTTFSDMVLELMINKGDMENVVRQVHSRAFETQPEGYLFSPLN
jgi:hypothetical protein